MSDQSPTSRLEIEIESLLDIGRTLTSRLRQDDVLRAIFEKTSQMLRPRDWTLFLRDPGSNDLRFALTVGRVAERLSGRSIAVGEGIVGWVAKTGEPLIVEDTRADARFSGRFDRETGFETRSLLAAPLVAEGDVLGVIELVRGPGEPAFTRRQLRLLVVVAAYAAIAIVNARQFEHIEEMARRDYLSPLYNSRYVREALDSVFAEKNVLPVSLVFFDIDRFKTFVDRYGHVEANSALARIGAFVHATLPSHALGFRFGGDEFVVVLPRTPKPAATEFAREFLDRVRAFPLPVPDGGSVTLTASFGVATVPDDAKTPEELLRRADEAMYRVKGRGKDGVETA
jgi:diguanylate cyclase (GGDEF)-like protein